MSDIKSAKNTTASLVNTGTVDFAAGATVTLTDTFFENTADKGRLLGLLLDGDFEGYDFSDTVMSSANAIASVNNLAERKTMTDDTVTFCKNRNFIIGDKTDRSVFVWDSEKRQMISRDPAKLKRVDTGVWEVPTTGVEYYKDGHYLQKFSGNCGTSPLNIGSITDFDKRIKAYGEVSNDSDTGNSIGIGMYLSSSINSAIVVDGGASPNDVNLHLGSAYDDATDTYEVFIEYTKD